MSVWNLWLSRICLDKFMGVLNLPLKFMGVLNLLLQPDAVFLAGEQLFDV